MSFTGVRFHKRHDSEECNVAVTRESSPSPPLAQSAPATACWVGDDIEPGVEADEESIDSVSFSVSSERAPPETTLVDETSSNESPPPCLVAPVRGRSLTPSSHSSSSAMPSVASEKLSQHASAIDETLAFIPESPSEKFVAPDSFPESEKLPDDVFVSFEHLSWTARLVADRYHRLPLAQYRYYTVALLVAACLLLPPFLAGLFCGFYVAFIGFLVCCVSDPLQPAASPSNRPLPASVVDQIAQQDHKERSTSKVYKGWMNVLNERYDAATFHVDRLQTVLVRLDGNVLRISRPERALLKHASFDDPTLTKRVPTMISQSIYDLTDAEIKLRPCRLAKRRWFSRKYPICVQLASAESEISCSQPRASLRTSRTVQNLHSTAEDSDDPTPPSKVGRVALKRLLKRKHRKASFASTVSSSVDVEVASEAVADSEEDHRLQRSISAEDVTRRGGEGTGSCIYLFARSAREKERWFHRLRKAAMRGGMPLEAYGPHRKSSLPAGSLGTEDTTRGYLLYLHHQMLFCKHLRDILGVAFDTRNVEETGDECGHISMDLGRQKWSRPETTTSNEFVVIANLLATRLFYDFCRDKYWVNAVRTKMQTKLATIHLPYFIETLDLSELDFGTAIPRIKRVFTPSVDGWGTWIDFDVKYDGRIRLVLETKVNLMKLRGGDTTEMPEAARSLLARTSPSHYSDEEVPESPETSPDEDFGSKPRLNEPKKRTGRKLLSLVDKIAHSKYFKEASELKPVKKVMEEISSTRLILNVEITALEGTSTINLPPPPSDRLWYGFRAPPVMCIRAVPQFGERSVVFSVLSDWIEAKMQQVLEKALVAPNLDDVVIPILSGNDLLTGPLNL